MSRKYIYVASACGTLILVGCLALALGQTSLVGSAPSTVIPTPLSTSAIATARVAQATALATVGLSAPPPVTPPSLSSLSNRAGSQSPPPGMPAIHPTIAGTDPQTPNFTAADAKTYITSQLPTGSTTRITDALFMTSDELKTRWNFDPQVGTNRLLCVVQMSGTFTYVAYSGATPRTYTVAYKVFDAHTGNLLLQGEGRSVT